MTGEYIAVVGSLNYDILVRQSRLPAKGETFTGDSVHYEGGGKGANQAVQCAKLGVPTKMIGKVGPDVFGDYLRANLARSGVDLTELGQSDRDTGLGVVHVLDDGSVYATIITGANFDFSEEDLPRIEAAVAGSAMVILQLEIPVPIVEHILAFARSRGIYTILNAAPAKPISAEALAQVDCLVVNETEASFYAGVAITDAAAATDHFRTLTDRTGGTVIITLGAQGSLLCRGETATFIPAVAPPAVVETTGAGDSYIGAFARCKYLGMTDEAACQFAARVASVTVTRVGAQGAMPTLMEVEGDLNPRP